MHNTNLRYRLLGLLLCIGVAFAFGQGPIRFQNITVNDGLSMGTITDFQQDHKGYMWIATAEGLHRFDGKHFKIFKHRENQTNSLSDSYIHDLLSQDKKLYIGTDVGTLDIMDEETYAVSHLDLKTVDPSFDYSIDQLISYQGNVIINTNGGGLWQYNPTLKNIRKLEIRDLKGQRVSQITVVDNNLILLTSNSIVSTDLNHSEMVFTDENIRLTCLALFEDKYLLGTSKGLYSVNKNFGNTKQLLLPEKKRFINIINTITVSQNKAWIGTAGGLLLLKENAFTLYRANQLRQFSLLNDNVSKLFLDEEENLWIGTQAGISKYAPSLKKFELLQYFELDDENFNNNVYYTYEDRSGSMWLGTLSSGLIKLDANNAIEKVYPKVADGPFKSNSVRCIFEDSKGIFWIGTSLDGIFTFNKKTGKFTAVANTELGNLKSNTIREFYEDSKGRLWVGTLYGLALKDSASYNFEHFRAEELTNNNSIYQIEELVHEEKLILASFRGGLQIFDIKRKTFTSYKNIPNDTTSISNNNLMSMAWVNKDTLLIGTYGGGLNIFDLRTKIFSSVTEADGLVNNAVYGILYHGNGNCWLSTNYGLVNYNLYTQTFKNFKPIHYLQSTEFNEGAFTKTSTGYYYFGGVNGLNYFRPEEIKFDTSASPIYFTDVRGQFTAKSKDKLALSFLNSRLEIDFMSLYYSNPEAIEYFYKLEGYDNEWISSESQNTAIYARLSPGTYTFKVRAAAKFGNWVNTSEKLTIVVSPPFWQSWWFITLSILLIASLIYILFRYRTREIERSYKLQLVDLELAALRSQMNPHFIFNSLNSIQYFILKKEPREAYTYLSKFASLMRKILQNSRLRYITVADEIEGLNLYLEMEKMRMDNNLNFTITTKNMEDLEATNIPTMLIQPFVENSIVHGLLPKEDNRTLRVIISKENDHLKCTIIDNGIGREASKVMNAKRSSKHTSAGMSLTQKRLRILSEGKGNFDVKITDVKNEDGSTGTEVSLIVPIITEIN